MYCPTEHMIGDFFSKPTQGALFKYFRNIVMGYAPTPVIPDPTLDSPAPEERVGGTITGSGESKTVSWADIVRSGENMKSNGKSTVKKSHVLTAYARGRTYEHNSH